ncbi:MAG TPA: cob(I)yrinic acid a,c-diamide adenosyltransferase [Candidatus Tyrphobacter sp.]
MAKHTRIYTRTGDDGTTGLYGGGRVSKDDPRIEAYGTIDELSSAIGVARATLHQGDRVDAWLAWVQDKLFDLGAELATPVVRKSETNATPVVSESDVKTLERAIDESEATLPPLDTFIHSGGSPAGALLHLARTICRRAERRLCSLRERDPSVDVIALRYCNRLSDALFVWARRVNAESGASESPWRKGAAPPD